MTDAPSEPLSGQPKPRRRWFDLGSLPRAERTLVLACILFWSVLSFLFFSHFVLQAGEVEGDSMVPTMQDGQRYIIWRLLTLFRAPERGEIICFRMPGEEAYTVKRVIALPGEVVQVRGGRVHVGGVLLEEPYLVSGMRTRPGPGLGPMPYRVPPDWFIVLGDNRDYSSDSRSFGPIPREWIVGVVK